MESEKQKLHSPLQLGTAKLLGRNEYNALFSPKKTFFFFFLEEDVGRTD